MIHDPFNHFTQQQPLRHAPDRTGDALSWSSGSPLTVWGKVTVLVGVCLIVVGAAWWVLG